jgi:hypothetical protein
MKWKNDALSGSVNSFYNTLNVLHIYGITSQTIDYVSLHQHKSVVVDKNSGKISHFFLSNSYNIMRSIYRKGGISIDIQNTNKTYECGFIVPHHIDFIELFISNNVDLVETCVVCTYELTCFSCFTFILFISQQIYFILFCSFAGRLNLEKKKIK